MDKKVGILYHPAIDAARPLGVELEKMMHSLNASVWLRSSWEAEDAGDEFANTDLIISIGGDGTILRVSRAVLPWSVPILGINMGSLGFMTELNPDQAILKLPSILNGEGRIEERTMLQVRLSSDERLFHALNDVVLGRDEICRVVKIRTCINGELLITYKADGIIIATATGSTGYSIAVGGPVLHPQAEEMILLPVAPHLSLNTALVLPSDTKAELEIQNDKAMLSIDGQVHVRVNSGDTIKIERSPYISRFLRTQPAAFFYRTLVGKLIGDYR